MVWGEIVDVALDVATEPAAVAPAAARRELASVSSVPYDVFVNNRGFVGGNYFFASEVVPYAFDIRRARALSVLSPYGRRYLELAKANALGRKGVQLMPERKRIKAKWDAWGEDVGGGLSFAEVQAQAVESLLRDGEILFGAEVEGNYPEGELRLRQLDSLALDYQKGVDYGADGNPLRYKFDRLAETGLMEISGSGGTESLPAADVVHLFERIYPRQRRGLTWFRPAFGAFDALERFSNALVENAVLSAKNPLYIELGEDYNDPDIRLQSGAASYGEIDVKEIRRRIKNLMDGESAEFQAGTKIHPINRAGGFTYGSDFHTISMVLVGRIAAGLGPSYAALAGDVSNANFSSLRHGRIEDMAFYRRVQGHVGRFARAIYRRWLANEALMERVTMAAAMAARNPKLVFAGFEYIEPTKDANAHKIMLDNKTISRGEIIRESGRDPEEVFAEIAEERKRLAAIDAPMVEDSEGEAAPAGRGEDDGESESDSV